MKKYQLIGLFTLVLFFGVIQAPGQVTTRIPVNDKITHFTTATTLTFFGGQPIEGLTGWKYSNEAAAVGVFAAGLYKEYKLDAWPETLDIAANFAGVMVGYYVSRKINRYLGRKR
jgi:hypothetical protein